MRDRGNVADRRDGEARRLQRAPPRPAACPGARALTPPARPPVRPRPAHPLGPGRLPRPARGPPGRRPGSPSPASDATASRLQAPRPPARTAGGAVNPAAVGRRERARGPGRRGQAPKGTGGMPRRHQIGRGRLRKVRGSCPTSVEPGRPEKTRGTETSQYPEEKKSTETPSVAASERGPA